MSELHAANPTERVQALLKLTQRLTELLQEETRLFKAKRPQDALGLQDEKTQLANVYRAEVARTKQDPTRFATAPAPMKAMLREATQAFHTALSENGHVVNALKVVTEGVVKAIADEAARQRSAGAGYGPGATARQATPQGFAVAVNRTA
ncbi:flagellar basal-body protein FlbY [Maricaulis parjimensis]|uniref:flagellar basal-body protein FlbY n=1 Tax=Maricaulis parjimensis TaxID=144023 RepID=UPI001939C4A3|nr:flagellar basal-body protein FlbY [Maricaulis parjimensis]